MDLLQAAKETVMLAKEFNTPAYLYHWHNEYWNDWMFKAYPGGRKVLSIDGRELAKKEGFE